MKKILITGVNSYVGNSFAEWIKDYPNDYSVDKISVRGDDWKEADFSVYDTVLHVAGIAHRKETNKNKNIYYRVNRDLTYKIAEKAKNEGVKQFIFLSTMSVYGLNTGVIDENTPLKPNNSYGESKLQAEKLLQGLDDSFFKITIIRPPMIYGKGCKGNYRRLKYLALKTPVFPNIKNKRSMIYIDNLSIFIKKIIDNFNNGVYRPQNKEYVNTSDMVQKIANIHGKKIKFIKIFNPLINNFNLRILNKVFGNLVYEKDEQKNADCDNFIDFNLSIKLTEE